MRKHNSEYQEVTVIIIQHCISLLFTCHIFNRRIKVHFYKALPYTTELSLRRQKQYKEFKGHPEENALDLPQRKLIHQNCSDTCNIQYMNSERGKWKSVRKS